MWTSIPNLAWLLADLTRAQSKILGSHGYQELVYHLSLPVRWFFYFHFMFFKQGLTCTQSENPSSGTAFNRACITSLSLSLLGYFRRNGGGGGSPRNNRTPQCQLSSSDERWRQGKANPPSQSTHLLPPLQSAF